MSTANSGLLPNDGAVYRSPGVECIYTEVQMRTSETRITCVAHGTQLLALRNCVTLADEDIGEVCKIK